MSDLDKVDALFHGLIEDSSEAEKVVEVRERVVETRYRPALTDRVVAAGISAIVLFVVALVFSAVIIANSIDSASSSLRDGVGNSDSRGHPNSKSDGGP